VFVFECFDTGFFPDLVRTDAGPSTLFIKNSGATREQTYKVVRKRGGSRKVVFQGTTIPGQTITGDTKFRKGDAFTLKEVTNNFKAKIFVE
jgi:hypothetical protein